MAASKRSVERREERPMSVEMRPTVEEIKALLGLEPHPTCGFVAETYRSPLKIPAGEIRAFTA